jgi:hypothetical protein
LLNIKKGFLFNIFTHDALLFNSHLKHTAAKGKALRKLQKEGYKQKKQPIFWLPFYYALAFISG